MQHFYPKFSVLCLGLSLLTLPVYADVIPDNTLGTTSSPGSTFKIEGGTQRGTNLFHSFSEFSIDSNQEAKFTNIPLSVTDVFARVTGGSASVIDGKIRMPFNPAVNLYLINPNGITFGSNASLVIRGSFFASTAESIIFNDGSEFSATNPTGSNLLTVSVPTALQFGNSPGAINVENPPNLEPFLEKTIALVGGDINIQGSTIRSENGRVELGSVGNYSRVGIDANSQQLNYDGVHDFQDISLTEGAKIDESRNVVLHGRDISLTEGAKIDVSGNGSGNIVLHGRNISLTDGSSLLNIRNGTESGGGITVNASESLTLRGTDSSNFPTSIQTETALNASGSGTAGNINIQSSRVTLEEGARISSSTYSSGIGGDLNVKADRITITGVSRNNQPSALLVRTLGLAEGGNLNITSSEMVAGDRAIISTQTLEGNYSGGDININSDRFVVEGGAQVQAGTRGAGDGGQMNIRANTIFLRGTGVSSSGLFNQVETENATGNSGDLRIDTQKLFVERGAKISARTLGQGNGGQVLINASESVDITGTEQGDRDTFFSGIITQVDTNATGRGGDIEINTTHLNANSGGAISGGTIGAGEGGNVTINASESVNIRASEGIFTSGISARTRTAANAGNLSIHTQTLTITDGASATVESLGMGNAGNMEIVARLIDMNQGTITGETTSGEGGNLIIVGNDIRLLNNSSISTTAGTADAPGNGGNITIVADTIAGLQNSDITANSFRGEGGQVNITTQGLFGLAFREDLTSENDITAISLVDPRSNGEVNIQTPEIDPTQGLTDTPTLENPELIVTVCPARATGSPELKLGGRAIPSRSADILDDGLISAIAPVTSAGQAIAPAHRQPVEKSDTATATLRERELLLAQGWYVNGEGQLVLTATSPQASASVATAAAPTGC
ncbi:MAG: S-layer family protein [Cyanobacteria bacterium P01_E01_bin.42]